MNSIKNIVAELNRLNADIENSDIIIRMSQNDINYASNYVEAVVARRATLFKIEQISASFPEEYTIWKLSLDSNSVN